MPTSRVNGVDLYWETAGDGGDPLVLVHGSWGDHHNWEAVVPALARTFRVLSYDRRGHSQSERPAGQGSVREDVADLAALLEERGHAPAHVVGSSFGGSIVLRLAAERPELFRSLVVHEPPLFALLEGDPEAQRVLAEVQVRMGAVVALLAAGDMAAGARQFVETVALGPESWVTLPEAVRQTFVFNAPTWLDEMRDPEALDLALDGLRGFPAPALLTTGDQSGPHFAMALARVASALPVARSWTYQGAGHVPQLTHAVEYVRVVGRFLETAET